MIIDRNSAEHKMLMKLGKYNFGLSSADLGLADRAEDLK